LRFLLFSDPKGSLRFYSLAVRRRTVRHLFPRPVDSDVRHPGLSFFFYPIRVRVAQRQPSSGTIVRIDCVYLSVTVTRRSEEDPSRLSLLRHSSSVDAGVGAAPARWRDGGPVVTLQWCDGGGGAHPVAGSTAFRSD